MSCKTCNNSRSPTEWRNECSYCKWDRIVGPETTEKLIEAITNCQPPVPKESKTCGFCKEPCGNEWCCMNEEKK